MDKNLEDIIRDCKKGDRNAFNALYNTYARKVFPICLRYSGNTAEAEDNLQEGFIIIFNKINTYKGSGSFDGWIKRIFINQCLSGHRNKKHISYDDIYEDIPDSEENETIEYEINTIIEIIQNLPTQYRLVFNMFILDSYSHSDISKELKISIGTSKSNLSRAKQIIKNKLKESKEKDEV